MLSEACESLVFRAHAADLAHPSTCVPLSCDSLVLRAYKIALRKVQMELTRVIRIVDQMSVAEVEVKSAVPGAKQLGGGKGAEGKEGKRGLPLGTRRGASPKPRQRMRPCQPDLP